jgi:hypothetical protein
MQQNQGAIALIGYLNRAIGFVPTTGAEWDAIRSFLPMLSAVASGERVIMPPPAPEPETAAEEAPRDK